MYNERFAGALPIHGRVSASPDRGPGHHGTTGLATPGRASARFRHALRALRGTVRHRLGRVAARLIGPRAYSAELRPEEISSVLICRVNARMGNTVFLTPLIRRIHERLPHASIDLATAYPKAEDLLGSLPGVRGIIRFPHKGIQLAWRYVAAVRRLRRERYDLAIDPAPNSTNGRIALMLARARYRLGYATDAQWTPLTHAVPLPDAVIHQAVQPAFLASRALGAECDTRDVRLWLPLERREIEAGRAAIASAIASKSAAASAVAGMAAPGTPWTAGPAETTARAFGFFAHATGLKELEPVYWRAFWDAFLELQPDAIPVEILPTPSSAPTDSRAATVHFPSPRALTAAMAAMRLFISADTGPMHLASSTDTPTVGLFRASDPTLYGPLKPCDLALDATRYSPRAAAECCRRIWRESGARTAAHESGDPANGPPGDDAAAPASKGFAL